MSKNHKHRAVDRKICKNCDFADKENGDVCSLKIMYDNPKACRFPNYD